MASKAKAPAIGIDFGTTYSRVSVFRNGKVEIIPNRYGNLSTPNYVTFDSKCLIGDAAKAKMWHPTRNMVNTIFDVNRFMGAKNYSVHPDSKYYPFEVISDTEGKLKFFIDYNGENRTFYPEEIFTMVLSELKKDAEAYLEMTVTDAVITVSPAFNFTQRHKIKEAATTAGFNVLRLINDTAAAAFTYSLWNFGLSFRNRERNVLIFDLGGGKLSVTIVTIKDGMLKVRSVAGNSRLGGVDFDNRMVTHFVQEFKKQFNRDLSLNKQVVFRLRAECQKTKQVLSRATRASIHIDGLFDCIDFHSSITRTSFEEMNKDLFQRILETVKQALRDAKFKKKNVHDILLLGGSSHIPKVKELLKGFFMGKTLKFAFDPEEDVVRGAAIQAEILTGEKDNSNIQLLDVAPASLGIEFICGEMTKVIFKMIERNTTIPAKQTMTFTTCADFQRAVLVKIYEGEDPLAADNHLLGKLFLRGLLKSPRKIKKIEVTFDLCCNEIITVTAVEKGTGNENKVIIGLNKNEEIKAMAEYIEKREAKRRLERFISDVDVKNLLDMFIDVKWWLSYNQNASKEEYEIKNKYLDEVWHPFITKLQHDDNANAISYGAEKNQSTPNKSGSSMNGASEEENEMQESPLGLRRISLT